ncbi:MAG: class II fumarate hydratase [Spirochaetaceae bacterium]|nr:MAG: class II fumarate hydratase [Spirochaetaceae bacterium]
MDAYRYERDSLGEVAIPADAIWGAQTQRAVDNFDFSGYCIPDAMRRSIGLIKAAAAFANVKLQRLSPEIGNAIEKTGLEIWQGAYAEAFPVEIFQTGSGTSWNMNANEVIARLATQLSQVTVHPNDHVNMGQSSNDVIPSAINVACLVEGAILEKQIKGLMKTVYDKALEFHDVVKLGRTHLQDAVPVRLGDGFAAVVTHLQQCLDSLITSRNYLQVLALGGTAAGTGLNTHPQFAMLACERMNEITGYSLEPSAVPSAEMNCRLPQVSLMGALQMLAVVLQRWCVDLRLLSSGPNGGLGEINLPELQPGSSIMPGKINPVIPEAVQQIAVHVSAKQTAVAWAASQGPLELNIMFPLIAYESLESLRLLANACYGLSERCVRGITANRDVCRQQVESSLALITKIAEDIGYDRAAKIALKAQRENRTLRNVMIEEEGFSDKDCDKLLDPLSMLPEK